MAQTIVTTNAHLVGILTALVDAGAPLDGAKCFLYQNDVVPNPGSVIGDFTPCDYAGSATEAITWLAPSTADDGTPQVVGTMDEFRPTDATDPEFAFGLVVQASDNSYIGAARFDNGPLPMQSALDSILATIAYRVSDGGIVFTVS